ncbi:MAG: hypothetical protein Q8R47_01985 [Nanoarchaeota archaeon]|nr:hypothetical protein [Nanoarchaeota archaeon]
MIKQKNISRHHVLLVCLLIMIITLGVAVYVLQRNAAIKTVAGEAFRQIAQRANPPGDLGLAPTPEPYYNFYCPEELTSIDQHWNLLGWKLLPWKAVDVQCSGKRMTCYYSDSNLAMPTYYDSKYILHADHIAFYQDINEADNCAPTKAPVAGSQGCKCQKVSS